MNESLWPHFPYPSGKLAILAQPVNLPNLKQWVQWVPLVDMFDDATLCGRLRIFLRCNPGATLTEIREAFQESDKGSISGSLGGLKQKGHIYTSGDQRAYRYFLAPELR